MLQKYYPFIEQYKELWAKYSGQPKDSIMIYSQEVAAFWSMRLKDFFIIKAVQLKADPKQVKQMFIDGSNIFDKDKHSKLTKVHLGLAMINALSSREVDGENIITDLDISIASNEINKYGLFFDFNTIDDLFLEEEDEVCVYITV